MAKKIKQNDIIISPEQAITFLEDMRVLQANIDEPRKPISLRIPQNLLRLLKIRAKVTKRPYQAILIDYIRKGLSQDETLT